LVDRLISKPLGYVAPLYTMQKHSKSKAYSSCAKYRYCCLVNQHWDVCESSAGKSSWGRTSNLQEDYPGLLERDHRTQRFTTAPTPPIEARAVWHLLPQ